MQNSTIAHNKTEGNEEKKNHKKKNLDAITMLLGKSRPLFVGTCYCKKTSRLASASKDISLWNKQAPFLVKLKALQFLKQTYAENC